MEELRLLGPVELVVNGRVSGVSPPQRGGVLAALAVDVGRQVSADVLVDRVWGAQPPAQARRGLHAHVSRLRRLLDPPGGAGPPAARLLSRSGGYLLDAPPERVDVHRFLALVGRARARDTAAAERVKALREALELWRGSPLAGLSGTWAYQTREVWRLQRLDAMARWADAELAVGNAPAVIGPLLAAVDEEPLAEPLTAELMRALYAVGRGDQALECYRRLRARLVDELGAEPSSRLREVQQAILRDDLRTLAAEPVVATAPVTPAQLPADLASFVGRASAIADLDALLGGADCGAPATVIAALIGTAGVGKTTLAVHWAHRVRDRFPDGQLCLDLRGYDPGGVPVQPDEGIRAFLEALGVEPRQLPGTAAGRIGLYRSLLADRRMLVLLDNARSTEQLRPLLPGAGRCLVLVTSRDQLAGLLALEGASPVTVDLPAPAEARSIIAKRLGRARVSTEAAAVNEIIDRCARLPLALAIVSARAALRPQLRLDAIAAELRVRQDRLDALGGDDPAADVRAVFSWSYHLLHADAARLFRLLGLHPGPDISVAAAASLIGVDVAAARRLLAELNQTHLLTEAVPGRYTFHDLLRVYATERTHVQDTDEQRAAAARRILDHYLHTAHAARSLLGPHKGRQEPTAPQPGVTPETFASHPEAMRWFAVEHRVLIAAVRSEPALAAVLEAFLDRRGHWHDCADVQKIALRAAQRGGDLAAEARARGGLGRAYSRLGRNEDAYAQLRRALLYFVRLSDRRGQAYLHINLCGLLSHQERHEQAVHHAEEALRLYRAAGDRGGEADALNVAGWCHGQLGDYERCLGYATQALRLYEGGDNRWGHAATLDTLGYAHYRLEQHLLAIDFYQDALQVQRQVGDRLTEAVILDHLGDAYAAAGQTQAAHRAWGDARTALDQLRHPMASRVHTKIINAMKD